MKQLLLFRLRKLIFMRKITLTLSSLCLFVIAFGQSYKKDPSLAVHYVLNDFKTAAEIRATSLSNVLRADQWNKPKRMSAGIAASYIQGLGEYLDFAATLTGSFVDYPVPGKIPAASDEFLLEAAATANLKLLSDKYCISPYLTFGLGASKFKGYYGAFIPAGVGLQINIYNGAFLLLNSQYRIPVTESVAYHFYHSIGIAGNIFKAKK